VRIVRSLIPAVALVGGTAALMLLPAGAQIATPKSMAPPAQNATPPSTPLTGPMGAPRSFADLAARLMPAVVNVSTTQKVEVGRFPKLGQGSPGDGGGAQGGSGNPLEELFRRFQEQQGDGGAPVTREAMSLGSGFIVDPSGYVVTNNHVISGGDGKAPVESITVTLADRHEYKARVVGRDTLSDLALLKIDATNLPYVNQGNSGGPLFDIDGNVIGINTAIFSPSGGNVGLGFAIPAEQAAPVIQQLRTGASVRRGYLGVGIQPMDESISSALGLPKDHGEIVRSVEPNGPASRAGLKQGDVVTRVAGQDVTYDNTLSIIVANTPVGARVPIEVIRDGKRQTLTAQIVQRPSEAVVRGQADPTPNESATPGNGVVPGTEAARQSLGITLTPLTSEVRGQLKLAPTVQGVVIAGIDPNSDAAAKDLQRGDVILSINQRPTPTPAAAAAAVAEARAAGRNTVLMLVQRGANPGLYIGIKLQAKK